MDRDASKGDAAMPFTTAQFFDLFAAYDQAV
jgi:hypothetical protein